jgi:ribosomal protein S18 acetylase RimI-like enzyme
MNDEIRIRPASETDFPTLIAHRLSMFRDMGWTDETRLRQLAPIYEAYLRHHLGREEFEGWIAEEGGRAVGGVGLLWEQRPPTVRNLGGTQAYLLALYVEPAYRRRGVARALARVAVERAREGGADVVSLHAMPDARGLYEQLGFVDSPEMRLFTDPAAAAWFPGAHAPVDDAD